MLGDPQIIAEAKINVQQADTYILCTSPRSGSTMLCSLLAATGCAGRPASYFHEPDVRHWLKHLNLNVPATAGRAEDYALAFSTAMRTGDDHGGVFGLRLQRHSFEPFMGGVRLQGAERLSDRAAIEKVFGKTVFIHLTRQDKLGQAISYVKADQTGLWHQAPDGTEIERLSAPKDPAYDGRLLKRQVDVFLENDRAWEDWFQAQQIAPTRIEYKDLSENPKRSVAQVLQAIGQSPEHAAQITPKTAKLADKVNAAWRDRYIEEFGAPEP